MKVRIARKKIKNDVLLQLWYKHILEWYELHNGYAYNYENPDKSNFESFTICDWFYENAMKHFVKIAYKKYGINRKLLNRLNIWAGFCRIKYYNYA